VQNTRYGVRFTVHCTGIGDFLRLTLKVNRGNAVALIRLVYLKILTFTAKNCFYTSCDGIPFIWETTETFVTPVYQGQGRIESCPDPCPKCMGNAVNAFLLYVRYSSVRTLFHTFSRSHYFSLTIPYCQIYFLLANPPPPPFQYLYSWIKTRVHWELWAFEMYFPASKSLIVNRYCANLAKNYSWRINYGAFRWEVLLVDLMQFTAQTRYNVAIAYYWNCRICS
jgi:hypothetical protein